MLRAGRHSYSVEHTTPSGAPVRLTSETWWVILTHQNGGGAFTYQRPRFVESGGIRVTIVDIVGLTRLVVVAFGFGTLLRRITS
jgi:hypothetical protein